MRSAGLLVASAVAVLGGYVSVAGHRMFYECRGSGRPTVVLDAGSPDTSSTWRWVQPQIARLTTVCAYDRAAWVGAHPRRPGIAPRRRKSTI